LVFWEARFLGIFEASPNHGRSRSFSARQRSSLRPDFFVAAHAQTQADRLLTHDREFYSGLFPSLKVVDPGAASLR